MTGMDVVYLVRWDENHKVGTSFDHTSLFELFDEATEHARDRSGRVYQVDEGDLVQDFREQRCHHTHTSAHGERCVRDEEHEGKHIILTPRGTTPRSWLTGDPYLAYAVWSEIQEAADEQYERESG